MWDETPADLVHALLTVLFVLVAVHALGHGLRFPGTGHRDRVDHLLHAAMAAAMAAMPWSVGRPLAGPPAVLLFTAAALWFPLTARLSRPAHIAAAVAARLPSAVGMAAMAWMLRTPHGTAPGVPHGPSHETLAAGAGAAHHTAGTSPTASVIAAALTVCLLVCGVRSLTRPMPALRRATDVAHRAAAADPYGHARDGAMALATAVMLLMPH